jgi:two-component system alkaline phosphatase synthesis response regulator PhoP
LATLSELLSKEGHTVITALNAASTAKGLEKNPDAVLVDILARSQESAELWQLITGIKKTKGLPLVALLPEEEAGRYDFVLGTDEFVLKPYRPVELIARIRRVLKWSRGIDNKEVIRHGTLLINVANYEVAVGGKRIELTYKEYELLKFLALNKGKVFNRDTLLNRIWGYDYYGGDRTVDVHIRRLRSKIEDSAHTFIETVRNVGYRFTPGE